MSGSSGTSGSVGRSGKASGGSGSSSSGFGPSSWSNSASTGGSASATTSPSADSTAGPAGAFGSVGSALGDAATGARDSVSGAASKIVHGAPTETVLHTTGYSFQDNQGGNNATISCGVIHKTAGGTGTYNDPITVAVPGHAGQGTQIPCGTEIYMPDYQRYFIVEDTGATAYSDAKHIDIYVGGEGTSTGASQKCMDPVTTPDGSPRKAIINPQPGLPVDPGPITGPSGQCNVPSASGGGSSSLAPSSGTPSGPFAAATSGANR
jgi:3D (Asp-Asp-Asp) domain-containing protein